MASMDDEAAAITATDALSHGDFDFFLSYEEIITRVSVTRR